MLLISIHAPARGATGYCQGLLLFPQNFNPRSRTGSDGAFCCRGSRAQISIHAPARGATFPSRSSISRQAISIHAPARGATLIQRPAHTRKSDFNPRSRTGSDVFSKFVNPCPYPFQSTLPHGERPSFITEGLSVLIFQSTLPHGERLRDFDFHVLFQGISIHAPARGATLSVLNCFQRFSISIHAPARGATISRPPSPLQVPISIHAPARGATPKIPYFFQIMEFYLYNTYK